MECRRKVFVTFITWASLLDGKLLVTGWFNLHNLWKGKLLTREVCFGVAVLSLCPLCCVVAWLELSLPEFIVPGIYSLRCWHVVLLAVWVTSNEAHRNLSTTMESNRSSSGDMQFLNCWWNIMWSLKVSSKEGSISYTWTNYTVAISTNFKLISIPLAYKIRKYILK